MNTNTVKSHYIELGSSLHTLVQSVESFFTPIVATVSVWASRSNDRQQLSQMNTRMLADIGLNHGDVAKEVNKFFWQK
jgi:uncharacterized protein YjiS (DUF1127 family)